MNEYNPEEFTLTAYKKLLSIAKRKFKFRQYTDYLLSENFILWRHDVDFSLEQALLIAQIEAECGIKSTFFLHVHNEFYNLLDIFSLKIVRQIIALGHAIGLHFDAGYYQIDTPDHVEHWLLFEKNILENIFSIHIAVFSFHNPDKNTSSFDKPTYSGMINTYSQFFKTTLPYCSDSNGYWRYRKLKAVLEDKTINQLQVLTHPDWWTENTLMPRQKILSYAEKKSALIMANYDRVLLEAGRDNLK